MRNISRARVIREPVKFDLTHIIVNRVHTQEPETTDYVISRCRRRNRGVGGGVVKGAFAPILFCLRFNAPTKFFSNIYSDTA